MNESNLSRFSWHRSAVFLTSLLVISLSTICTGIAPAQEWESVLDDEPVVEQPGKRPSSIPQEVDGFKSIPDFNSSEEKTIPEFENLSSHLPVQVIQRFLKAQVNGDIDAMLGQVAVSLFESEKVAQFRLALNVIRRMCRMEELISHPRAICYNAEKTKAIVRFEAHVSMAVKDETFLLSNGFLCLLQMVDKQWKILFMEPDEFLNMQFLQAKTQAQPTDSPSSGNRLVGDPINWQELNQKFDKQISTIVLDDQGTAWDILFSAVGAFPVAGDAVSMAYTGGKVIQVVIKDMIPNISQRRPGFLMLDIAHVACGVFSMAVEAIPMADHLADTFELFLDNAKYNFKQRRQFIKLKAMVRHQKFFNLKKYLVLVPEPIHEEKTNGLSNVKMQMYSTWQHQFSSPLKKISFITDRPLQFWKKIRFYLCTEFTIKESENEILFKAARDLRTSSTVIEHWTWQDRAVHVPVQIPPFDYSPEFKGEDILRNYRIESARRGFVSVAFDITSSPGPNQVIVFKKTSEKTEPLKVENTVYNNLKKAWAANLKGKIIKTPIGINVGENGSLSLLADSGAGYKPLIIGLPGHKWKISDPEFCSLITRGHYPEAVIELKGWKAGETNLAYTIKTGSHQGVNYIHGLIPIKIGDKSPKGLKGNPGLSVTAKNLIWVPDKDTGFIIWSLNQKSYKTRMCYFNIEIKNTGPVPVKLKRIVFRRTLCDGTFENPQSEGKKEVLDPGETTVFVSPKVFCPEKLNYKGRMEYTVHATTLTGNQATTAQMIWNNE